MDKSAEFLIVLFLLLRNGSGRKEKPSYTSLHSWCSKCTISEGKVLAEQATEIVLLLLREDGSAKGLLLSSTRRIVTSPWLLQSSCSHCTAQQHPSAQSHSLRTELSSFSQENQKINSYCLVWRLDQMEVRRHAISHGMKWPTGFKRRDALQEVISFWLLNLYTVPWVSGHEAIAWDQP